MWHFVGPPPPLECHVLFEWPLITSLSCVVTFLFNTTLNFVLFEFDLTVLQFSMRALKCTSTIICLVILFRTTANLCIVKSTHHRVHGGVLAVEWRRGGRVVADQVVVVVERQALRHLDQVTAHRVQALADEDKNDQAGKFVVKRVGWKCL